jgi:hypothetical protein
MDGGNGMETKISEIADGIYRLSTYETGLIARPSANKSSTLCREPARQRCPSKVVTVTTTSVDDMRKVSEAGVMAFARRILPTPFAPPIPALGVTPFLFAIPTKIGVPTAGLNGKD